MCEASARVSGCEAVWMRGSVLGAGGQPSDNGHYRTVPGTRPRQPSRRAGTPLPADEAPAWTTSLQAPSPTDTRTAGPERFAS